VNSGVGVGVGWVDSDYRGAVVLELKNVSSTPFRIDRGDHIAQVVILRVVEV
jgi:dUTPase